MNKLIKIAVFLMFTAAFMSACSPNLAHLQQSGDITGSGSSINPDEMEIPAGVEIFGCPVDQQTLLLKVSADLTIRVPTGEMHHTIEDGVLELTADNPDRGTIAIINQGPSTLIYTVNMNIGDCTLNATGPVSVSARGVCKDGIVWLTITEDWGSYEGTITCEDTSTPTSGPSIGQMIHTGQNGEGEIFYMDSNFSQDSVGWMLEKQFAQGEGTHTWTLLYDVLSPTGLTP